MKPIIYRIQFFLVVIILMAVPSFWVINGENFDSISVIEGRELAAFPENGWIEVKRVFWLLANGRVQEALEQVTGQASGHSFRDQFTTAASDQFPARLCLIRAARSLDLTMIYSAYAILPDQAVPTNTKNEIFITWDQSTVIKGLPLYTEQGERLLDSRIAEIAAIANQNPDIEVYVFYSELLAYSQQNPMLSVIPDLDGGRTYDYLKENLPPNITLDAMILSDVSEYNENFYHTDHHWNIRGAWNAYQEIYTMISVNYPSISPVNESIQYKNFPNLLFLGTYARDSLYPFKPEIFEIGEVTLPEYQVYTRDYAIKYNLAEEYNAGVFSTDPYVSRYAEFFGANSAQLIYFSKNNAEKDLLLIGSSYKIPLQPWLASHYQTSYFINPANYPDFSLPAFLEEHPVDDIIILTNMNELLDPDTSFAP
jgi:hypothetical protein